ncbi:MAG: FAD-binding oxidoreductase [Bifidobacteriaceae bacterium]|jgi:sarcosine oxidase subunit beta|nr:FAD-binding oxidoreductase [Bifidobacteriaceae bacterium]
MSQRADVVVIGAGVLGAAAAFEMAQRGLQVAVLERGVPNREGSGTTAGNLHIQAIHTRRPGQDVPVNSARLVPLQAASSRLWDNVEDEVGADFEVRRTGGFMVAETEADLAQLTEKAVWEKTAGLPTRILTGDEARAAMSELGPTIIAATWCETDGYANPLLAAPAWLAAAKRLGAAVLHHHQVTALTATSSGWQVVAGGDTWGCAAVVNVAGPWLTPVCRLAGLNLPMKPLAIQMHVTTRSDRPLPHLVQHIGRGLSVKQVVAGNCLIGGGWPALKMDLTGRSEPSVASLTGNLAEAARVVPMLRHLRLLRTWAGPLAATPDEMPLIGQMPGAAGLFVAGGTYAFTFAPLWAKTLAALVCGDPPPIEIGDLGPSRLMEPA